LNTTFIIISLISFGVAVFFSLQVKLEKFKDRSKVVDLQLIVKFFLFVSLFTTIFGILLVVKDMFPKQSQPELEYVINGMTLSETNGSSVLKNLANGLKIHKVKQDFNAQEITFDDESIQTITLIFMISGVFLGTLGIFWLAHLEENRLDAERKHDQKIQKDKLKSLLTLLSSILEKIDRQETINFITRLDEEDKKSLAVIVDSDYISKDEGTIYINKLEEYKDTNEVLHNIYKKNIIKIYKFLYEKVTTNKKSLLSEVDRLIETLENIFFKEDLNFQADTLLKDEVVNFIDAYKKYQNSISKDYKEVKLDKETQNLDSLNIQDLVAKSTTNHEKMQDSVIEYLAIQYKKVAKNKGIFYEYFSDKLLGEFNHNFLISKNDIFFREFDYKQLIEVFTTMNHANLDTASFFARYLSLELQEYIENQSFYKTINLEEKDLSFDVYLSLFNRVLQRIALEVDSIGNICELDIRVKELLCILDKKDEVK